MKLLALTTSFPLRAESSAGVFVRRLYEHLPAGWEVLVLCPADAQPYAAPPAPHLRVHPIRYAPRRWRTLAQQSGGILSGLRRSPWRVALLPALLLGFAWQCLLRGRNADLIHANWAVCGAIAGWVGAWMGKPVVTTLRGDDVTTAERSRVQRWLLNAAVRRSTAVICVCEPMRAQLQARYPQRAAAMHACPNGIEERFFQVAHTPRAGPLRVLAIGSLIVRKGLDVLLDAVARMQHGSSLQVRIVGEGPERDNLDERARRLGIAARVTLAGAVPPDGIPAELAAADVLVLSSHSEGRPNVVIEALAAGVPVISSDLPGVADLVQDGINGWIVRIGDAHDLARALDEAVQHEAECARRGDAGRRTLLAQAYGWEATGLAYEAVFRKALASAAGDKR